MNPLSLCQPDTEKSCGACCGLYNYRGGTRKDLHARLGRRTEFFRSLGPPSVEKALAFSRWAKAEESQHKLLETIYNCEFLGFLDADCRRVGCLLHPQQNQGKDLRSCSFYGADLCASHLCLSHQKLTPEEKWCVIYSLQDWYLYGICITDIDLCKSFFRLTSARLGAQPSLPVLRAGRVRQAARDFFSLKVNWSFRSREEGRFGKYCLAEDEYREARIDYAALGGSPSRYDDIFLSLESDFSDLGELEEAERIVDRQIDAFVKACESCQSQRSEFENL
jgi:hypothetical protein